MTDNLVLDVRGLKIGFQGAAALVVKGIDLQVGEGEIVGLVGESGSGKSITSSGILRLLPRTCSMEAERFMTLGQDLLSMTERDVEKMRGSKVAMVFQEPMTALNPIRTVGRQLLDVIATHRPRGTGALTGYAERLLLDMRIEDPARVMKSHPHQLSGGMRQRVLLAMAFSCTPRLLIADEPLTALDASVQRQVLELIRERASALGTAVLFITHDLAVVRDLCKRVYVMRRGEVVESGPVQNVLGAPAHPYTRALMAARPELFRPKTELGLGIASGPVVEDSL